MDYSCVIKKGTEGVFMPHHQVVQFFTRKELGYVFSDSEEKLEFSTISCDGHSCQ